MISLRQEDRTENNRNGVERQIRGLRFATSHMMSIGTSWGIETLLLFVVLQKKKKKANMVPNLSVV